MSLKANQQALLDDVVCGVKACVAESVSDEWDFLIPWDQDSLRIGSFSFERQSTVYAQFLRRNKLYNDPFVGFRDWIGDSFLVSYSDDRELLISAIRLMSYSYHQSYEEQLQRDIDMAIANPSSHILMARVAGNLARYRCDDDIRKVFYRFSEENRESYFGRRIRQFLDRYLFENSYLPAWDTGQIEPIIQDTTKYTLIIFSASWCAPCHRLIPVLKEIHSDLYNYLNIIYISTDEQRTVQNWRNLMIEKEIPWRSLLAVDDVRGIKDKFFVQSIPHSLLVHPNGKMERLGVNVRRVYEIVNRD